MNQQWEILMTEEEIEENCECGLTEAGLWSESLFEQWGCECKIGERQNEEGYLSRS